MKSNKHTTFLCLVFALWTQQHIAQQATSKLNVDLYRQYHEIPPDQRAQTLIPALVKGNLETIKQLTTAAQGKFKCSAGNIASIQIPLSSIWTFVENTMIQRIDCQRVLTNKLFDQDTITLFNNNIIPAHQGWGNLPQGYQGEGTLVGVIDDGFDWKHPDFQYPDSTTRVLYLWDQDLNLAGYTEPTYGYGSVWTKAQMDAQLCGHSPNTHGTHVAGIAAGNARAAHKFMGVAPKADLAWVAINESGNFLPSFVDAVHYIFSIAEQRNQPCAINSSVGTYFGSHDGKDLYTEFIENLLDERPGRALIQAAGNARQYQMHLGVDIQQDTSRTWFNYYAPSQGTTFVLYGDTAELHHLDFSFQWIDKNTAQTRATTRLYNVLNDLPIPSNSVATLNEVFCYNAQGHPIGIELQLGQYNGVYELWVYIYSPQMTDYWQLTAQGTGKFDIWSHPSTIGTSEMLIQHQVANYKNPDSLQTLVSNWTCSDKIITVASYQNQNYLKNYWGDTIYLGTTGFPQFGISPFSSLGPTRDGRQKPDITASGGQVLSACPLGTALQYQTSGFAFLDSAGFHVSNRGTSMSAPLVAGASALYFQCQPNATYQHLKQALAASARVDSFVQQQDIYIPNIHWGYGKLDVYQLLNQCLVYGCMDSNSVNYNPLATLDDGSCLVVSNSNLANPTMVQIIPNPIYQSQFFYRLPSNSLPNTQLFLYNTLGQMQQQWTLQQNEAYLQIPETLPAGIYWLVWQSENARQVVPIEVQK